MFLKYCKDITRNILNDPKINCLVFNDVKGTVVNCLNWFYIWIVGT